MCSSWPSETNTSSDDDCVIIEPETESDFQKPDTSCNIPRPAKTNLMINTKKHLSSANHFPANSRIFNRSLQVIDWNWIFSKLSKNKRPDKNLDFVNRGGAECKFCLSYCENIWLKKSNWLIIIYGSKFQLQFRFFL